MGRPKSLTDFTGMSFGKLTVIELDERKGKQQRPYWMCQCECGNTKSIRADHLKTGNKEDCGCVGKAHVSKRNRETKATHGLSGTRLFKIWNNMTYRCENPKSVNYQNYGGRGISVCEEWRSSHESFIEWAMKNGYEDHLTIDRIENEGNYEPSNCRWATMAEQNRNKRKHT